jgi:hypothetical protein
MFEGKQNESPYSKIVTVTETVFTKRTLAGEFSVKNAIEKFKEIEKSV